jgi:hypothetical protein
MNPCVSFRLPRLHASGAFTTFHVERVGERRHLERLANAPFLYETALDSESPPRGVILIAAWNKNHHSLPRPRQKNSIGVAQIRLIVRISYLVHAAPPSLRPCASCVSAQIHVCPRLIQKAPQKIFFFPIA